jgi:peptidoglycan/xylan/chitin deacetylase (PgdA/CDA1 family)
MTHPVLTDLSVQEADHEIEGCKSELEHRTGSQVQFFAYPYGIWSPPIRALVQRHYHGACSTGAGAVEPNADPFALPRVDAAYLRRPMLFRTLFTAPFHTYVATRRFIRRVRRQPEGLYSRV